MVSAFQLYYRYQTNNKTSFVLCTLDITCLVLNNNFFVHLIVGEISLVPSPYPHARWLGETIDLEMVVMLAQ